MKQKTKELSARIHAAKSELDRLTGEIDRCNAAINAADEPAAQLQQLQKQRSTEIARAFVESRAADVAAIDNLIRVAEKSGARAREQGEAAREALQFVNQRRGELEAELTNARAELTEMVLADLAARRAAAKAAFARAVDALREPMEDYLAIDAAQYRLDDAIPRGNFAYMPGRMLMVALQSEGLRVWTERGLQGPDWFADLREPGANEKTTALFDELRALGLEV